MDKTFFNSNGSLNIDKLESRIKHEIRKFKSNDILISVNNALKELENPNSDIHRFLPKGLPFFTAAGIASFAVRFTNPHRNGKVFDLYALSQLEMLVTNYLLADPITFDKELAEKFKEENPIFLSLRHSASQFSYNVNPYASYSQTLILYGEAIKRAEKRKDVPAFDFHFEFQKITGATLEDFLSIGLVAWSAAQSKAGFARGYFEVARQQGLKLPDDDTTVTILNNVSATPTQFRGVFENRKNRDRRFRAYDFNPLFSYPIIRPWKDSPLLGMDSDRLTAPIPNLICYRISTGIYYQMFNNYLEEFSQWFGLIFEEYVGIILENSINRCKIYSEDMIKRKYKKGKLPDWVVVEGDTAIIFQVKATKFSRVALTTASEEDINNSLKQVIKGLVGLHEFRNAILTKAKGLEEFHDCSKVISVFVSFGSFYLINSFLFEKHVNKLLNNTHNINSPSWIILSIDELEELQPYLYAGIGLAEIMKNIESHSQKETLDKLQADTGITPTDSFLYKKCMDLFEKILIMKQNYHLKSGA